MPRLPWSDEELAVLAAHPELPSDEFSRLLPGRSAQSVQHMRGGKVLAPVPLVKPSGDYVEIRAAYLVDELEAMEAWLHWNGYASFRELSRDKLGWVTVLCTSKE